jgi:DNA-binding transcriptional ArsR family regulator
MGMDPRNYFRHPRDPGQCQYEALRASFLERLSASVVAQRFHMTPGYIHVLKHRFRRGLLHFTFRPADVPGARRGTPADVRTRIVELRRAQELSAGQIAEILEDEGTDLSIRTVERILREAGFSRLPRRTRLLIGQTRARTVVPEVSRRLGQGELEGMNVAGEMAGLFAFAPFIELLGLPALVARGRLPGSKPIPSLQYFLSFLALKLAGTERLSHTNDHNFDPALGLFAGLNVLPKCTAMSTYAYSLDGPVIDHLQRGVTQAGRRLGLYASDTINLDFHAVPHWGDQSVLDKNWVGARNKGIKSALTLFAQDCTSKLILYAQADIRRSEADDQVLDFVRFWRKIARSLAPTLVFDSRFTSYVQLDRLDRQRIRFITLRRRGPRLIRNALAQPHSAWKQVTIPHEKRKYPRPWVLESRIALRNYPRPLRQIIMRGTGHEKPTFLITNDLDAPVEVLIGRYARRWNVENVIAEAVKFFHLNALSSPILVKVHFDVVLTAIADTLYYLLAQRLRGFEECNAPQIFRHFIQGKGQVTVSGDEILVRFPRRAHNPLLRAVPWNTLPERISWLGNRRLRLAWQ